MKVKFECKKTEIQKKTNVSDFNEAGLVSLLYPEDMSGLVQQTCRLQLCDRNDINPE